MATLKLKADISELKSIEQELKRLNELMKPLRTRKKEIESNILKFMESSNQQQGGVGGIAAIKMSDVEVVAVEKKTREKLHKDEKEQHAIELLKSNGIQNASKVYSDLQEVLKGKEHTQNKLKFKDNSTTSSSSSSSTFNSSNLLKNLGMSEATKSTKSLTSSTTKTTKSSLDAFNIPVPNFVHPSNVQRASNSNNVSNNSNSSNTFNNNNNFSSNSNNAKINRFMSFIQQQK